MKAEEQALVSDILQLGTDDLGQPKAWRILDEIGVTPDDFSGGKYSSIGKVWAVFQELRLEKVAIDIVTAGNRLGDEERRLLLTLSKKAIDANHVRDHAAVVLENAAKRRMKELGAEMIDMAESEMRPEDALAATQGKLLGLIRRDERHMTHVSALINPFKEWMKGGLMDGPGSGITDWDRITGGFAKGKMSIVAGRPAMGKSSLAAMIAKKLAVDDNLGVVMFHLEDSTVQIVQRIVQMMTGLSREQLKGEKTPFQQEQIDLALSRIGTAPLYLDGTRSGSVQKMMSKARQVAMQVPLALVVVDYIQLLIRGAEDRVGKLADISRALAIAAGPDDLDCHMLVLSQLSRDVEKRVNKRPTLPDLRESGALEQDARIVTFVYRDWSYSPPTIAERKAHSMGYEPAELIVEKRNDGPTGTAHVLFHGPTVSFKNKERTQNEL